jgi:hypothetical protein
VSSQTVRKAELVYTHPLRSISHTLAAFCFFKDEEPLHPLNSSINHCLRRNLLIAVTYWESKKRRLYSHIGAAIGVAVYSTPLCNAKHQSLTLIFLLWMVKHTYCSLSRGYHHLILGKFVFIHVVVWLLLYLLHST